MQYFSYAAILLFCIQIQAFCIYNNLDEGGSFDIFDEIQHGNETAFSKTIGYNGAKECCHYSNTDCNPSQDKLAEIYFVIHLKFTYDHNRSNVFRVSCAAGGGLALYGTASDCYAKCTPPDGLPGKIIGFG